MKLEEAIEIKETELEGTVEYSELELSEADMICFEAAKELQLRRKRLPLMEHSLLPGETQWHLS